MMSNKWYEILLHFEEKKYVSTGLTIPFLIGIFRLSNNSNSVSDIYSFINELDLALEAKKVRISYCSYLDEEVVSSIREDTPDWLMPSYSTDYSITESYVKKFTDIIQKECYSKINNDWQPYSALDLKRINEVITRHNFG